MNRFQAHTLLCEGEALYQVGGSVRDRLLGRAAVDIDGVLLTADPAGAGERLTAAGLAPVIGRSGGQAWRGKGIDLTVWPRQEGQSNAEALLREAQQRDFTLNALYLPWDGEGVIDPLGGMADLQQGVLRATGHEVFGRDPVRVLRLARLASTHGFTIDPATLRAAQTADPSTAAGERIGREVVQWLTQSARPGDGMALWEATGALRVIPEVAALRGVAQRDDYHPEGDVWVHTGQVLDRAAELGAGLERVPRTVLLLAALFHDVGKAAATRWEQGRWRAHGHEAISRALTEARLQGWGLGKKIGAWAVQLVGEHGRPLALSRDGAGRLGWWRLLDGHPCPQLLFLLAQADSQGRLPPGAPDGAFPPFDAQLPFEEALNRLSAVPPLTGGMLLEAGVRPGAAVGRGLALLRRAAFLGQWRVGEPVVPLLRQAGLMPGRAKAD